MRIIYVDEAGISASEPVRVVAAVIVNPDSDARILLNEIERINKQHVPIEIREGFIFHAKEVFNGGRVVDRSNWNFEDRLDYLKEILCLPFVHDVPISLGLCFSGVLDDHVDYEELGTRGISRQLFEHGVAFSSCLSRADGFLKKYLLGKEAGLVVAEDFPENKKFLKNMALRRRYNPVVFTKGHLEQTAAQKILGEDPEDVVEEIRFIMDVPHFVEKRGAPLLQLADACAFAFRRYLSRQSRGDELILAMLGPNAGTNFLNEPLWFSGTSSGLFNTLSYYSAEQMAEFLEKNRRVAALQQGA